MGTEINVKTTTEICVRKWFAKGQSHKSQLRSEYPFRLTTKLEQRLSSPPNKDVHLV